MDALLQPDAAEAHDASAAGLRLPLRIHLHLRGAVQGVGFRPWCAQQALALGLSGWVRNDAAGLQCEVQGAGSAVQAFLQRLRSAPPPLARIDALQQTPRPAQAGDAGFRILASDAGAALATGLPADAAPCADCLDELFDPADRRHRYAFINCTHCGPRFTITERLPYDRPNTSLAGFPLCPACSREYRDPTDRRYHAQPVACPVCGPRLALWRPDGAAIETSDPLAEAARRLAAGQILAVKGVGGYHLVCDATQAAPLQRLRAAKQRARKPFALLVANVASARQWAEVDDDSARLLASPAAPILLLPTRPGVAEAHPLIAPGLSDWGLMLPAAPLHWLLIHELLGRPEGQTWRDAAQPTLLVMTSANPGGEPLVIDEAEALQRLGGVTGSLCDALLVHDRPILGRVDDSVRRPMRGADGRFFAPYVRRARGYVPDPIELPGVPADAPPVLATGAWMKNTVCLTRGNQAFLSPHIGDLGSAACRHALVEAVQRLRDFLGVRPQLVAHDLHPDFFSTRHAQAQAAEWGVPSLAVQHHHAHAAAVRAEHGAVEPTLALLLDGVGLGDDGTPWGGELFRVERSGYARRGHLPTLALAGGDRAAAEPWRLGAAVLHALGRASEIAPRFAGQPSASQITRLLERGLNCPATPSAGRLFDAAAALLGLCPVHGHEGEAAMKLEAAADDLVADPWADSWHIDADGRLSWPGLWARLADTAPSNAPQAAAAFHATLVAALADWVAHHAGATGLSAVALGGGCFINRRLRNGLVAALTERGLTPLEARQAPPGDGGLALGQAALALDHLLGAASAARRP